VRETADPDPTPVEPVETKHVRETADPDPTPVEPVETTPVRETADPDPTPVEPVETRSPFAANTPGSVRIRGCRVESGFRR
jgi:hypothetical protein